MYKLNKLTKGNDSFNESHAGGHHGSIQDAGLEVIIAVGQRGKHTKIFSLIFLTALVLPNCGQRETSKKL